MTGQHVITKGWRGGGEGSKKERKAKERVVRGWGVQRKYHQESNIV